MARASRPQAPTPAAEPVPPGAGRFSALSNLSQPLAEMAASHPQRLAVIFPLGGDGEQRRHSRHTFQQLDSLCNRTARGLFGLGLGKGSRVLLLVRPGITLISAAFALLRLGAVPVIIDPGMGWRPFLRCVQDAAPAGFIGIPQAHLLRLLFPAAFRSVQCAVVAGRFGIGRAPALASLLPADAQPFPPAQMAPGDEAAIAFTSGGTGLPKGVVYRQEMFLAQLELLRTAVGIQPGEVDLPGLTIFSLFGPALGTTEAFPELDPSHPARVNPARLVQDINAHGVTHSFGSPVIWRRVADHCMSTGERLPTLRRIYMAGAPVPPALVRDMKQVLEGGEVYTPFGATEALPLTMMSGSEILEETAALSEQGAGMCVGRPVQGLEVRIIRISDEAIPEWEAGLELPPGEAGEIAVRGPVVTRQYVNRPDADALAKIREGDTVWHRMGDLGYFDEQGRLWFCGRKVHRVQTAEGLLLPVCCEAVFNAHPRVQRTAVVGVGAPGRQEAVLVVEPTPGRRRSRAEQAVLQGELLSRGAALAATRGIRRVLFYPRGFPVDVRHNAKIDRLALGRWAAGRLGRRE